MHPLGLKPLDFWKALKDSAFFSVIDLVAAAIRLMNPKTVHKVARLAMETPDPQKVMMDCAII